MKKIIGLMILFVCILPLFSCDKSSTVTTIDPTIEEKDIYKLLTDAENLSGMSKWNGRLITESGSLDLPTAYKGVVITYSSRNPEIISNSGVVTLPDTCWIESRDQQGTDSDEFANLNDNWPIVVDVTMTYKGQTRTAKLMFLIAPNEGFTCDKYLGNR